MNTAVQMGFFQTPTVIKDKDEIHGDLVSQVEQIFGFVKKHINCAVVITGKPENDLVWDYPLEALREIILNMIVHRDYRSPSESCIKVFADHIEFFNPGKFLDDIKVEDLLNNNYLSTLRNKAIANHFHQLGEIEKYGSGITRVIKLFHDAGLKSPKFEIAGTGVKVTVWAQKVADKAADKVADKVADKISPSEGRILSVVTQYPGNNINGIMSITGFSNSYIRKILTALIQMGKVEHRGSKKTGGYYAIDQ